MERVRIESTNVASIGYNGADLLEVEYKPRKGQDVGPVYQYPGVPPDLWAGLLRAPSKGHFIHQRIKTQYRAVRVS